MQAIPPEWEAFVLGVESCLTPCEDEAASVVSLVLRAMLHQAQRSVSEEELALVRGVFHHLTGAERSYFYECTQLATPFNEFAYSDLDERPLSRLRVTEQQRSFWLKRALEREINLGEFTLRGSNPFLVQGFRKLIDARQRHKPGSLGWIWLHRCIRLAEDAILYLVLQDNDIRRDRQREQSNPGNAGYFREVDERVAQEVKHEHRLALPLLTAHEHTPSPPPPPMKGWASAPQPIAPKRGSHLRLVK